MTTAPAEPRTLYGPDGQALAQPALLPAEGWQPVRAKGNAVVWERPRPVDVAPPADDAVDQARAEAGQLLAAARTEAEQITAEARSLRARTLGSADHDARVIREQAAAEVAQKEARGLRLDVWMARAVIAGAVGLTAFGEYSLARLAHFPKEVAWLLPFVIDIYVIQAFRRHRDIKQAIALTIAANVVYHLAAAGMFGVTTSTPGAHEAKWWLIALVSSIASVILWRMHVITAPQQEKGERLGTASTAEPVQVTAPVPAPVAEPVPATGTAPEPVPALRAVPDTKPVQKRRRAAAKARRSTAPKPGTGTASFDAHVDLARGWLTTDPDLSGTDIGKRLGTGDSYGRRVKRAALSPAPQSHN